jgi:histidinol-phosphatase (PHP family)
MVLPPDYHMHTPLCRHACGTPSEYAAQALRLGLSEIGFTDHSPMPEDGFDDWRMRASEIDAYVAMVHEAQAHYPALSIKLGLEVDFLPGMEDWIRDLRQRHPWDYFIGSVHYIGGGWDIDNPYRMAEWKKHDVFEVWSEYFERLTQAAASGLFDIIGHADLAKKFRHRPDRDCTGLYERFLRAAKSTGAAIEINTAGLRKDCQEMYPSPFILQQASRLGIGLTFGSDAHRPEEVGADFAAALSLARRCGFTHHVSFTRRSMSYALLPAAEPAG